MRTCIEKITGRNKPTHEGSYDRTLLPPTHEIIAAGPEREDAIQETKIIICSRKIRGGTNPFSCLLGVYVRVSPFPFLCDVYELSLDGVVSPAWIRQCSATARAVVHLPLGRPWASESYRSKSISYELIPTAKHVGYSFSRGVGYMHVFMMKPLLSPGRAYISLGVVSVLT